MTLVSKFRVSLNAVHSRNLDLGAPADQISYGRILSLLDGVGADQADLIFHDTRTLNASANEDLDLAGVLTNEFGVVLSFVKLKAVILVADRANVNNVRFTRPASNSVPLFVAASDAIDLPPGAIFAWISPITGVTVTPATGDLLNVANGGAGTPVNYDVIFVGTSA